MQVVKNINNVRLNMKPILIIPVRNKREKPTIIPEYKPPSIYSQPWRPHIDGLRAKNIRYVPSSLRHKVDISLTGLRRFWNWFHRDTLILSQRYQEDREVALGRDLACAHFIVARGGAIRFVGHDKFIQKKPNKPYNIDLPKAYDPSYKLEAIDAANIRRFFYEGIENFKNLKHLKAISFKGNEEFNDWHIDYLCATTPTIEYLDISFCKRVTYRGIITLYKLRYLKGVNVEGISNDPAFKLACLSLEHEMNYTVVVVGVPLLPSDEIQPEPEVQPRPRRSWSLYDV